MAQISEELRRRLKKPLGKVVPFKEALETARGKKIIAVGDEVVCNFLEGGVVPFVSVFDLNTLREHVGKKVEKKLMEAFPSPEKTKKEAGEISEEMFGIAERLLEKGGALYVEGEEDLFALPFALLIKKEIVVYGQPGEGCVIVDSGSFDKEEIVGMLEKSGLVLPH